MAFFRSRGAFVPFGLIRLRPDRGRGNMNKKPEFP
jgi:hypothetical protein